MSEQDVWSERLYTSYQRFVINSYSCGLMAPVLHVAAAYHGYSVDNLRSRLRLGLEDFYRLQLTPIPGGNQAIADTQRLAVACNVRDWEVFAELCGGALLLSYLRRVGIDGLTRNEQR